jgi:hypothetical protein
MLLRAVQQLTVHANMVALRIGLGAKLRHHLPIHLHAAFENQLLSLAPRNDPSLRNDLL